MIVTTPSWGADEQPPSSASVEDRYYGGFLLSTPQIEDPLQPLKHAGIAWGRITVHSAVVGVADPLETQLGRAFDIQLSSLIRAFHARGYVLDGFAVTWNAGLAGDLRRGSRLPGDTTTGFQDDHRSVPSVLIFRRDGWRALERKRGGGPPYLSIASHVLARYVVLFLVGESPTFGLHPESFLTAAKCAAALNGVAPMARAPSMYGLQRPCTKFFDDDMNSAGSWSLEFIGPTFSGSMQSLAISLGEVLAVPRNACAAPEQPSIEPCATRSLRVNVTSPSASVKSNARVADWAKALSGDSARIEYTTFAASLEDQLVALCKISALDNARGKRGPGRIVVLAEESSFGKGVSELLASSEALGGANNCDRRIVVRMFPQNIAAVRGEQTRREEQSNATVSKLLSSRSRLLPLDLSEVGESIDRPPAYHRLLSSRSDELMLYQAFDALRVYVQPVAVAIVATDVRDRLFLLNEVRRNLPTALPVLMEMDFLTAHPDYRSISRGSVVIPNGDTIIKLHRDTGVLLPRFERDKTDFFVFPADYAANMFRAALGLIDRFEGLNRAPAFDPAPAAKPYVTTLAGFQAVPGSKKQEGEPRQRAPRSVLLAADSRLAFENPFYLGLALVSLGLLGSATWLLQYARAHLIMVSPLRNCNPRKGVKEPEAEVSPGYSSLVPSARTRRYLSAVLVATGLGILVTLLLHFSRNSGESSLKWWALAHGRDVFALIGSSLAYAGLAVAGFWRLTLWQRRFDWFRSSGGVADPAFDGHDASCPTRHNQLAVPALVVVLLVLVISLLARGLITSVDSPWPSMLITMTLLPVGAWFLTQFWTQARHWSELTLALNNAVDTVSKNLNPANSPAEARWPSPTAMGELPQSPYSLQFRTRDLQAFGPTYSGAEWERDTRSLLDGTWPFGEGRTPQFLKWQARLVAEMRYASVAIRSAAWCGILAPTAVLIGLEVYPPYDQRLQTTLSVTMIVLGFLLIMYQALRLERDPLLGRMFTLHGDKLSLGSAFSTLWPKLIAAAVILIPVFFPDIQTWLFNMIRSVNSLQ